MANSKPIATWPCKKRKPLPSYSAAGFENEKVDNERSKSDSQKRRIGLPVFLRHETKRERGFPEVRSHGCRLPVIIQRKLVLLTERKKGDTKKDCFRMTAFTANMPK